MSTTERHRVVDGVNEAQCPHCKRWLPFRWARSPGLGLVGTPLDGKPHESHQINGIWLCGWL